MSKASAKVLALFLADPSQEQYGFGLMRATGVKAGTLYPILERLEEIGWVEGYDELIDERTEGRPRRRLYTLTPLGRTEAQEALVAFLADMPSAPWVQGNIEVT